MGCPARTLITETEAPARPSFAQPRLEKVTRTVARSTEPEVTGHQERSKKPSGGARARETQTPSLRDGAARRRPPLEGPELLDLSTSQE